jgi:hypothetical protein
VTGAAADPVLSPPSRVRPWAAIGEAAKSHQAATTIAVEIPDHAERGLVIGISRI